MNSDSDSDEEEVDTDGRRLGAPASPAPWTTQEAAEDNKGTQASIVTRVSRPGGPQYTSEFNIKCIHIPGKPRTANNDPSTPEVGSD